MYKTLIEEYELLRSQYEQLIVSRMNQQDYREHAEVLFSAHSCGIEGNSFTVDDTRSLKELGLGMVLPKGKRLYECFEVADHFRAFEYVMDNLQQPLDESLLKEVNRLVTQHTIEYKAEGAVAGEYTQTDMAAGDTVFGNHEQLVKRVPQLLESTERAILAASAHPMIIAARFHGYFEYLHPFRDGNGRTGRLLSNYILMRMGHPLVVVRKEEREAYIDALRMIRREGTDEHLIAFFFNVAISHFKEDLHQISRNNSFGAFLF